MRACLPAEISAAWHDRCIVSAKPEYVDALLSPEGRSAEELQAILAPVERPLYADGAAAAA